MQCAYKLFLLLLCFIFPSLSPVVASPGARTHCFCFQSLSLLLLLLLRALCRERVPSKAASARREPEAVAAAFEGLREKEDWAEPPLLFKEVMMVGGGTN